MSFTRTHCLWSMSDWEHDEEPVQPAPRMVGGTRRRFEDEDAEDEVKDDWEEEDEEPPAPAPVVPGKKRVSVKQKIAEKEEQERRRRELGEPSGDEYDEFLNEETEEEALARKNREKEAMMQADLDNAAALMGATKVSEPDTEISSITSAKPTSKEDWSALAHEIYERVVKPFSGRPGFDKHFFPALLTELSGSSLRDVDLRKGATKMRELAEEKVRQAKEAKRTGGNVPKASAKPKPKQVGTSSAKNTVDLNAYGDEALDDDLDFM